MNNKILVFLMNGITGRWFFIFLNLVAVLFDVYCIKYILTSIHGDEGPEGEHGFEGVNTTLNGIGGILISLGVLMESRGLICKMTGKKNDHLQEHLNESAEYCGMGLLLLGLFIEILTVLIEVPNNVVNTKGIEHYLYYGCILFIVISLIVEVSFIKDYITSYFKVPKPTEHEGH